MGEINVRNFQDKLPEIEQTLREAKFIGLDCEFSALYPLKNQQPSLFDSPSERYAKLRKCVEHTIPIQIGLTAFNFDPDKNVYTGKIYTFYVQPACFPGVSTNFCFQSSSLNFLKLYNFDFNKFVYSGIPYMNKQQEEILSQMLENHEISEMSCNKPADLEEFVEKEGDLLKNWYANAQVNDHLTIQKVCDKFCDDFEMLYFIHKNFRRRFKDVWTSIENNVFIVKRLTKVEIDRLERLHNLEKELLTNLLGFTRIFRLLTSLRKPIVGHNLLHDLILTINSFEAPLPESYSDFKRLAHKLFPIIYDTKSISYELRGKLPEEKRWGNTGLSPLFDFFKNGTGRHLAFSSPAIETDSNLENYGKFHEAGWDSFCAGYIFVRLAHLNIAEKYPKSKQFMNSELIGAMSPLKNRVNVIRSSTSCIQIDGEDPISTRPPWLVVESVKNSPVNITQILSIFTSYGFVEVRKVPCTSTRILLAVDNFGNARRILKNFKQTSEYRVKKYNAFKHSPIIRACVLSSITISGAILIWCTRSLWRK